MTTTTARRTTQRKAKPAPVVVEALPDDACRGCGSTTTLKKPRELTGVFADYPLCADAAGCAERMWEAAHPEACVPFPDPPREREIPVKTPAADDPDSDPDTDPDETAGE